jgi:predicted ATPase
MKIKSLVIENFKSIERIELIEPNPFTVFVGPNGSGKSNIFETLELINFTRQIHNAVSLFGGLESVQRKQTPEKRLVFEADLGAVRLLALDFFAVGELENSDVTNDDSSKGLYYSSSKKAISQFSDRFSRLFVGKQSLVKLRLNDNQRLSFSADNLEKVLKRILSNSLLRDEIFEWLELFVPGFRAVEVDDRDELHWFEQSSSEYFTKDLISDGTYNILALLTAVYQSDDKPQFLCIEEPENGLHPQVAAELVDFFRIMCEERGHYIWLNTHSQSMASRVRPNEFVVVEKKDGATITRQFRNEDFNGMSVDEAWLTNALNGGLAW